MVHFYLPSKRIFKISAPLIIILFVSAEAAAAVLQVIGATMIASDNPSNTITAGMRMYMVGAAFQLLFIVFAIIIAIKLHKLMLVLKKSEKLSMEKKAWEQLLGALYTAFGFIAVSSYSFLS